MGPAGHGTPDPEFEITGGWDPVWTIVAVGHARPPGREAREEAGEGTERLVRPEVDRALPGEQEAELAGDDCAEDQESEKAHEQPT